MTEAPPYRLPSMSDIRGLPYNGRLAISTFSGTGGSSLGYRMAGYRVVWANEFIPAAQEAYRANFPDTPVDGRDIRSLSADDILAEIGLGVGELDLMDGSPPCASFSMAGKREKGWGKVKSYSDTQQRVDDLFWEYGRLVEGIRPKVFVAENVAGLVQGVSKGYFIRILGMLRSKGYEVGARVLDAQWLGVPQMRRRVFFVGVRDDLVREYDVHPAYPSPLPYRYTLRDALPWVVRVNADGSYRPAGRKASPTVVASGAGMGETASFGGNGYIEAYVGFDEDTRMSPGYEEAWESTAPGTSADGPAYLFKRTSWFRPSFTIPATAGGITHPTEKRKLSIPELKRISSFPDDFILPGNFEQQWERIGRAVPPLMMYHLSATLRDQIFAKLP